MKRVLKVPHLWIIVAIMVFGTLVYYADRIPLIQTIVPQAPFQFARYSVYRILSLIPVAYAAFIFGLRGGMITAVLISMGLLPRAILFSSQVTDAVTETIAFFFIGLLVSWLIHRQQRTVYQLENTRLELSDSLQTISDQQKQQAALYDISTTVYQTLDANHIADIALKKVLEVTGAEVGWIYLKEKQKGNLVLSACYGLSSQFVSNAKRVRLGETLDGQVARSKKSLVMTTGAREIGLNLCGREDIGAILIAPLPARTGIKGTLGIALESQNYSADKLELLGALGNGIGIAVDHADLRKQDEVMTQQLRLSEERYRGLFENAREAIFVCSTQGRIISVNRSGEQLTGYTQDELSKFNIDELFSGTSREAVKQLFLGRPGIKTAGETGELRLTKRDGTEAFIQPIVSPLLRNDQIIGLQAIARDVTEERQLRQNMEYYISQITKAQEDERLRISRELHDDTAHVLAGLSRDLDALIAREEALPKSVTEYLDRLREMADSGLDSVRRFSQDLRPSILDDLGLVSALRWLSADLEKECGIATSINVTGTQRRLSPERELAVFRITQEALSNVKKHSQAKAIEMMVEFADDALNLIIKDNGQGFNMPSRTSDLVLSGKLGIIGMRERARLIGGTFIVQSEIGVGTNVTLRISG